MYLQHVEKFSDRDSGDAGGLVRQFEDALGMLPRITDHQKLFWFGTCLEGLARRWYDAQRLGNSGISYQELITEFLTEFRTVGRRLVDLIMQMKETRQEVENGQSVQEYAVEMLELFNKYREQSKNQLPEGDKITFFIDGLAPSIQEVVLINFEDEDGNGDYGGVTFKQVLKYTEKIERTQVKYEVSIANLNKRLAGTNINQVREKPRSKRVGFASKRRSSTKSSGEDSSKESDNESSKKIKMSKDNPFKTVLEVLEERTNRNTADIVGLKKSSERLEQNDKKQQETLNRVEDRIEALTQASQTAFSEMRTIRGYMETILKNQQISKEEDSNKSKENSPKNQMPQYFRSRRYSTDSSGGRNRSFSNSNFRDQRRPDGTLYCYKCGEPGHYANSCDQRVDESKKRNEMKSTADRPGTPYSKPLEAPKDSDFHRGTGQESSSAGPAHHPNSSSKPSYRFIRKPNDPDSKQLTAEKDRNVNVVHCLNSVTDYRRDLLVATARIDGQELTLQFDSGAAITCLSYDFFRKLTSKTRATIQPQSVKRELISATGTEMPVVGEIIVDVMFNSPSGPVKMEKVTMVVVRNLNSQCLIGGNILGDNRFDGYRISFKTNTITFELRNGDKTEVSLSEEGVGESKLTGKFPVWLLKDVLIPPSYAVTIIEESVIPLKEIIKDADYSKKLFMFEPKQINSDLHLRVLPSVIEGSTIGTSVPFLITNSGENAYLLKKGTIVGTCEEINDSLISKPKVDMINQIVEESSKKEELNPTETCEKLTHVHRGTRSYLRDCLLKFSGIFEDRPNGSTAVGLIDHTIDLVDSVSKPVKQYPYRVSPAMGEAQKKHISDMLKKGVIKISEGSPWASPVVTVPKSDGTQRFCTDFRKLNALTKADVFPLPWYDVIIWDKMSGKKFFTKLDLKEAFWQIEVAKKDQPKTAFICQGQLYEYLKMPFGLKNSPACFQRNIQMVIGDNDFSVPYLDDVLIFSETEEEHLTHIEQTLEKLDSHNLHCKLSKCEFFQTEISYLGFIVGRKGIQMDPAKVKGITKLPSPTTVTELRSFLGMCNFYRKFLENFSTISDRLTHLLKKNSEWNWTEECQETFEKIKKLLLEAPILACPDFKNKFILTTDASNVGIGSVLSQDFNGVERPVCFISRKLNEHEFNYATTHKECLAVVWSIDEFRHYLEGTKFSIRTDHIALKYLMQTKDLNGRLARWSLKLMTYDFEIDYIKGKDNRVADVLSRAPVSRVTTRSRQERTPNSSQKELLESETGSASGVQDAVEIPKLPLEERLKEVAELQDQDPLLRCMKQFLTEAALPEPEYGIDPSIVILKCKDHIVDNGVLFHLLHQTNSKRRSVVKQLVIPNRLKSEILYSLHEDVLSGHFGIKRTYEKAIERFFWEGMWSDIKHWVNSCVTCQMKKMPKRGTDSTFVSTTHLILSNEPMCDVSVDLIGPLPRTKNGNAYIVVFLDRFSRFPECVAIPNKEAVTIANVFVKEIICRYGCPKTLLSDQGREFCNKIADEVYQLCNTRKLNTSGYRPQTNGMNERSHPTLMNSLSAYVNRKHQDWDEFLPYACFAFRTSKNEFTEETPFYLLYHREPMLPIDRVFDQSEPYISKEQCLLEMTRRMREAKLLYEEKVNEAIKKKQEFNDAIKKRKKFDVGDLVLLFKPRVKKGRSSKLSCKWVGPFVVREKLPNGINYVVQLQRNGKKKHVTHAGNMKKFHPPEKPGLQKRKIRDRKLREKDESDSGGEEEDSGSELEVDYEIESIVRKVEDEEDLWYEVKWKGWSDEFNTLLRVGDLSNATAAIEEFERTCQL